MKYLVIFFCAVFLFVLNSCCEKENGTGEPCDLDQYYNDLSSKLNDLQLLEEQDYNGDVIQSPKYAVIRFIDYTPNYSVKIWHSALWGLAVDMANKSGLKEELKKDPKYNQILDIFSQILLAASEYGIRENIPFVQERLGAVRELMYNGSSKYITFRNSLQKSSRFVAAAAALLTAAEGADQLLKSPWLYDYEVEWYYYEYFIIPEVKKTELYLSNPMLKQAIDNYTESCQIDYNNFTTNHAEQLMYLVASGVTVGFLAGTGVLPGPGTVGGAIIGAAVGAMLGITAELLAGGTQFVLNHDIASRQLTLALSMDETGTINSHYLRTFSLHNGLISIKDKVLGNGLIQIVAGALGTLIENEESRWYDFMNNYFQPERYKNDDCLKDGISNLTLTTSDHFENLNGTWEGIATQPGAYYSFYNFKMVLSQLNKDITGTSRIEIPNTSYYGQLLLTGSVSDDLFNFKEISIESQNPPPGWDLYIKNGILEYKTEGDSLIGHWWSSGTYFPGGEIKISRK